MATQTDSQGRVMVDVRDPNAPPQWTPEGQRLPGPMSKMNAGMVNPSTSDDPTANQIPSTRDAGTASTDVQSSTPVATKLGDSFVQDKPGGPLRNANTPAAPHPMSKIFDSMLKMASGGPIYVNDPVTGQRREVPQTRGSMARAITAAALSGLFTPNEYRPGPFGGSVLDRGNTMAAAGRAGMEMTESRQKEAQRQVDDLNTRRMQTLQNNVRFATQMSALTHQKHADLQAQVDRNQDLWIKPLEEMDSNRTDPKEASYFSGRHMTLDELKKKGLKYTDNNVFMDGVTEMVSPTTGQLEVVPTYGAVRTTDKDGKPLMVKLPKNVTDELGKFSKPYEQVYDMTKGDVRVPVNHYLDAIHTYNTLDHVEAFLNRQAKAIDPKAKPIDIVGSFKNDPQGMWDAIKGTEAAIASGNGRPGEDTEDMVLDRIGATKGGANILNLLGTPDQIEKYQTDVINRRKQAQLGGLSPNAPMRPEDQQELIQNIKDDDGLTNEQKKAMLGSVGPNTVFTRKEGDDLRTRWLAGQQATIRGKIQQGDPATIAAMTRSVVAGGETANLTKIVGNRSGPIRMVLDQAFQAKATELGLNPAHFQMDYLERSAKTKDAYAPQGPIGKQLAAFQKFVQHAGDAKDANDAWARTGLPYANKAYSWYAENLANDQNFQRFRDSLVAPAKEYMNFLNQNRAEHTADQDALDQALNSKSATPQTIYTALQTFMKTSDGQAFAMGEQYRDQVGTTFPGLVSQSGLNGMRKVLGSEPRSANVSGQLPRAQSFVAQEQFQTLNAGNPADAEIAKRFARASGGDMEKATEMAREHGYIVSYGK